ncbi:nitroreductase family protein [Mariniplasma anaerobium]|uniref:Oxidoreductase n=1 Tax=Mariniplasma anaerobium TaxID=2735436 RepID=A0A7U9TI03_9MOLU|nr:nitroreductase family protein [Mariniplasma anaerobium]BCR35233.1 oxidoreductase [Mariniplasma anaerobium]
MSLIDKLKQRRSYREFEPESFDIQLLIDAIDAAKYAPNGANKQPWTFCIIKDPDIKKEIRIQSERIETEFYKKITDQWMSDLKALKVNTDKSFLDSAPYLIVIFKHIFQYDQNNQQTKVYYPDISVGIATGMLISILTDLGLDILTYTPSPNSFLSSILQRPKNERPYLILVVGKGSKSYKLPKITKKPTEDILKIY